MGLKRNFNVHNLTSSFSDGSCSTTEEQEVERELLNCKTTMKLMELKETGKWKEKFKQTMEEYKRLRQKIYNTHIEEER